MVSSAAEAGTSHTFHNCTTAIPLKHMLEALEHRQYLIPIKSDNSIALSYSNSISREN